MGKILDSTPNLLEENVSMQAFTRSRLPIVFATPLLVSSTLVSIYLLQRTIASRYDHLIMWFVPVLGLGIMSVYQGVVERRWRIDSRGVIGFGFRQDRPLAWAEVSEIRILGWAVVIVTALRTVTIPLFSLRIGKVGVSNRQVVASALRAWKGNVVVCEDLRSIVQFGLRYTLWLGCVLVLWFIGGALAVRVLTSTLGMLLQLSPSDAFSNAKFLVLLGAACAFWPSKMVGLSAASFWAAITLAIVIWGGSSISPAPEGLVAIVVKVPVSAVGIYLILRLARRCAVWINGKY